MYIHIQDSQGFLWLPLTYQLTAQEQTPGAPYPSNTTLAVHYPLPLAGPPLPPSAALHAAAEAASSAGSGAISESHTWAEMVLEAAEADEGGWSIDGWPIDSQGRLASGYSEVGSILSTM